MGFFRMRSNKKSSAYGTSSVTPPFQSNQPQHQHVEKAASYDEYVSKSENESKFDLKNMDAKPLGRSGGSVHTENSKGSKGILHRFTPTRRHSANQSSPPSKSTSRNVDTHTSAIIEKEVTPSPSVLESLKVIPFSTDFQNVHATTGETAYNGYRDFEVMTPDSRKLMLEQREAIRRILFDNSNNNSLAHEKAYQDSSNDDTDEEDETENLRASPPPPPPPPNGATYNSSTSVGYPFVHTSIDDYSTQIIGLHVSAADYVSQEVTYDGIIQDASIDYDTVRERKNSVNNNKIADNRSNALEISLEKTGGDPIKNSASLDETFKAVTSEPHGSRPDQRSRSMPISVDISYTESDLASVNTPNNYSGIVDMKNRSFNSYRQRSDDKRISELENLNNTEGNRAFHVIEPDAHTTSRTMHTEGASEVASEYAPTEAAVMYRLKHNQENEDGLISSDYMLNALNGSSQKRSLASIKDEVLSNQIRKEIPVGISSSPSRKLQPDDETAYDNNYLKKVNTPIPDDEEIEYNKDEMIEMTRISSAGSLIDVLEIRQRPLSLGGPGEMMNNSTDDQRYLDNDSRVNERLSSVALESSIDRIIFGNEESIDAIANDDDDVDAVIIKDESFDSMERRPHEEEIRIDPLVQNTFANGRNTDLGNGMNTSVLSDEHRVNLSIHSTFIELNSALRREGYNGTKDNQNNEYVPSVNDNILNTTDGIIIGNATNNNKIASNLQDIGITYQKTDTMLSPCDVSTDDSISKNIQNYTSISRSFKEEKETNNEYSIRKVPSFFYTSHEDDIVRFIRRITKHGFALLFLQPPGCLGNPTEDWKGRTVTMTIEKGIIPTDTGIQSDVKSSRNGLTSASCGSSVTFSTKSNRFLSDNTVASNRQTPVQHPRLQWMTVVGGQTTDVSITSVDLFSIQAVSASGSTVDDEKMISDTVTRNEEDFCCFTITTSEGIIHLFEATTLDERNRIVKGLKALIARLSYHIISGNPASTTDLYRTSLQNDLESTQSKSNPRQYAQIDTSLLPSIRSQNHTQYQRTIELHSSTIPHVMSELSKSDDDEEVNDREVHDVRDHVVKDPKNETDDFMNRIGHILLDA